jgi:transposase/regulator of replication initiation timing
MAEDSIAVQGKSQLKLEIAVPASIRTVPAANAKGIRSTLFRQQLDRQLVLLPTDFKSRLPEDHLVFFILEMVSRLDLSGILMKYENKSRVGRPAYDPTMMLTLILYCYCTGTTSARAIERLCRESVPCCVITGNQNPDHDTISNYLLLHREQFDSIFQQILLQADKAGLVKLDHAALDGSKLHANASKHKAMSYERMCEKVAKLPQDCENLEAQIAELKKHDNPKALREADTLRKEVKFKKKRLAKIKASKKKLERRAKQKAKAQAKEKRKLQERGLRIRKIPDPKTALPEPKEQINFTDADSRIMGHTGGTFEQCYNVQIVVDSHCQMIVAHDVVQQGNDKNLLEPMFLQVHRRLGRYPSSGSADAGYFTQESLTTKSLSSVELFVPPDRETHPRTSLPSIGRIPKDISPADRMRRKLSTRHGKELYAQRKCIVEPVFGQVKESVLEFDQFSWRGLSNVRHQWALVCTAHNLLKIHRALLREESKALQDRRIA